MVKKIVFFGMSFLISSNMNIDCVMNSDALFSFVVVEYKLILFCICLLIEEVKLKEEIDEQEKMNNNLLYILNPSTMVVTLEDTRGA